MFRFLLILFGFAFSFSSLFVFLLFLFIQFSVYSLFSFFSFSLCLNFPYGVFHRFFIEPFIVGADGGGGTPVPIPNTAVKPTCAEDTWLEAAWKNK